MAEDAFDNKNVELGTSDIEIGAVELKDHDGTDRAAVTSGNALKVDGSAVTQPVSDASGSLTVDGTVTTTPSGVQEVEEDV